MSIGLFDYNSQCQDAPDLLAETDIHETAQAMIDAQAEQERRERQAQTTAQLKASILRQLEQGNAPELILYAALQAIGASTDDAEWADTATGYLDSVYKDLMQQSLFIDSTAAATEKLHERRRAFAAAEIKKVKRALQSLDTITSGLEMALYEYDYIVNDLEPPLPDETGAVRDEWRKKVDTRRKERRQHRSEQLIESV